MRLSTRNSAKSSRQAHQQLQDKGSVDSVAVKKTDFFIDKKALNVSQTTHTLHEAKSKTSIAVAEACDIENNYQTLKLS